MARGWQNHALFAGEPYSRRDAWEWMIAEARFEPGKQSINGKMMTLERGQLSHSVRFLAEKWGWTKSTVGRFLDRLKTEGMVESEAESDAGGVCKKTGTPNGTGQQILIICNYDKYQRALEKSGTPNGTEAGQQRDKVKERKEGKKDIPASSASGEGVNIAHLQTILPHGIDPELWQELIQIREAKKAINSPNAIQRLLNKIGALKQAGYDPNELLKEAIINSWKSVFPPTDGKSRSSAQAQKPYTGGL